MKELKMLLTAKDPSGKSYSSLCIPKKYTDQDRFELQLNELEDQQLQETLKPFKPSGHAFVCFDSVKSLNLAQ